jgi:D-amino-acid dehydrogenase
LIPDRFVHQLAAHIQKKGVRLKTACEVFDLETIGRRATRVKTTHGDFIAQHVILAGGAESTQLARRLGLDLPMQPAKGYSITFRRPELCPSRPVALAEAKVVITPMENVLRFAGTLELAGFDESIDPCRVQAILDAVRAYLPGINPEALELVEIWRGLRPCSPDGLPFLGRVPHRHNVIVATGHGMLGISLAPISGSVVAQLVTHQEPSMSIAALSVERFN